MPRALVTMSSVAVADLNVFYLDLDSDPQNFWILWTYHTVYFYKNHSKVSYVIAYENIMYTVLRRKKFCNGENMCFFSLNFFYLSCSTIKL
jgi:hypothetical protein